MGLGTQIPNPQNPRFTKNPALRVFGGPSRLGPIPFTPRTDRKVDGIKLQKIYVAINCVVHLWIKFAEF